MPAAYGVRLSCSLADMAYTVYGADEVFLYVNGMERLTQNRRHVVLLRLCGKAVDGAERACVRAGGSGSTGQAQGEEGGA